MHRTSLLALTSLPLALTTASSKRGLVFIPSSEHPTDVNVWTQPGSDLTWYYNYGASPSQPLAASSLNFVPMLWGAPASTTDTTFYDTVKGLIDSGHNVSYVLSFNEPDGTQATGGSNVPADLAAQTWIREIEPLKALGVKLGAPAVTGAPTGFNWLQNFFTHCAGNCSADFVPVHWYGNFEGLASHVGQVRAAYQNMTVWVTEYADAHDTLENSQSFYNTSAEYFDRIE